MGHVSVDDYLKVQKYAQKYGIDPMLLVAIGQWETGWGTKGLGKKGLILGVGAYDSGPVYTWAGLDKQLDQGGKILAAHGVHNINDVKAGKAAFWTSTPGWQAGVISEYNKMAHTNSPIQDIRDAVVSPVNAVTGAVNSVAKTVYNMGIMAAVLVGAAVLIVLGFGILSRRSLEKAAGTVTKVAGVVK